MLAVVLHAVYFFVEHDQQITHFYFIFPSQYFGTRVGGNMYTTSYCCLHEYASFGEKHFSIIQES